MPRKPKYADGELVDYIRREILAGKYMPRERLIEDELSLRYNVSRTPIREALSLLETMGLVVREKNKGARVADIDLKAIHEMQQVRAGLEGITSRLAAERMDEDELAALEGYLINMEKAAESRDLELYTCNNNAFHAHISDCCGNDYLISLLHNILEQTIHRPCRTWKGLGDIHHTNRSHRRIYEALKAHDPSTAQAEATQHVLDALETQKRFSM